MIESLLGILKHPAKLEKLKQQFSPASSAGRTFLEKSINNAPFGLLITQSDDIQVLDPRIVAMPLSTFLLIR